MPTRFPHLPTPHDVQEVIQKIPLVQRINRFLARLGITSGVLLLIPILGAILWMRYFGLPHQVKVYVLSELEQKGLSVDFDRLLLDPSGGFLAERLTVYRGGEKEQVWIQVDRVRIGIAWFSWWRGQPFIESASVRNATLQLPLGPNEFIPLDEVHADVLIRQDRIEVLRANAKLLNFLLNLKGDIRLTGKPPARPATPEDIAFREKAWNTFRTYAMEFTGRPISMDLTFDIPTLKPQESRATLVILTRHPRWRNIQLEEVGATANLANNVLTLEDLHLQLARGEFQAKGEWDTNQKTAILEFASTVDFTNLGPVIGGKTGDILGRLNFQQLPSCSGRVTAQWKPTFTFNLQADLDWNRFSYANVEFERLVIPLAFDGNRLLLSNVELKGTSGGMRLNLLLDRQTPEIKAKWNSSLDPTLLKGMFGEAADRFLNSLVFQQQGPEVELVLNSNSLAWDQWKLKGKASAKKIIYKQVPIESASSDYSFEEGRLTLTNLKAKRTEGEASGKVIYDFKEQWVILDSIVANVMVKEIAIMFGNRFNEYMHPYTFTVAPKVNFHGKIDLLETRAEPMNDFKADISTEGNMHYTFLGRELQFEKPRVEVSMKRRQLFLKSKSATLFDGKFGINLHMDMDHPEAQFDTTLTLSEMSFQKFMKTFYQYDQPSGVMNGTLTVAGGLGKFETLKGEGTMTVTDGYILSIPFLGGLSDVLGSVIPNFGIAKAGRAYSSFNVADGEIRTKEMEITSTSFTLIGNGKYNFIKDNLDLDTRVNIRGVVGLLLFPVSKLFEYHGTGSLKNTKWSPKILE